MVRRPLRRLPSRDIQPRLLEALGKARRLANEYSWGHKFNSLMYGRCHDVMGTIDELAGAITGDRAYFHARMQSTPDPGKQSN
jgi:hypothetical protein